jgi:hypothetical protein
METYFITSKTIQRLGEAQLSVHPRCLYAPDIIGAHGRHHREYLTTLIATIWGQMGAIIRHLPDSPPHCRKATIYKWMIPDTTQSDMRSLIDELIERRG